MDVASLLAAACVAARARLHRVSIYSPGNALVRAFPESAALLAARRIQSLSLVGDSIIDGSAVRAICDHLRGLRTLALGIDAAAVDVQTALVSNLSQLTCLTMLDLPSICKDVSTLLALCEAAARMPSLRQLWLPYALGDSAIPFLPALMPLAGASGLELVTLHRQLGESTQARRFGWLEVQGNMTALKFDASWCLSEALLGPRMAAAGHFDAECLSDLLPLQECVISNATIPVLDGARIALSRLPQLRSLALHCAEACAANCTENIHFMRSFADHLAACKALRSLTVDLCRQRSDMFMSTLTEQLRGLGELTKLDLLGVGATGKPLADLLAVAHLMPAMQQLSAHLNVGAVVVTQRDTKEHIAPLLLQLRVTRHTLAVRLSVAAEPSSKAGAADITAGNAPTVAVETARSMLHQALAQRAPIRGDAMEADTHGMLLA